MSTEKVIGELLRDVAAAAYQASDALLGPARAPAGTIVPLYSRPLSLSWRAVLTAKAAHPTVPVIVIANPNSGPGAAMDSGYVTGIAEMAKAGIVVAGYVSTKYGARPEADVRADMAKWRTWYPAVTGIFFDEMNNKPGGESYYLHLSDYARGVGFTTTIGNPGADTLPSYVGVLDTIIVYERTGLPPASVYAGWHSGFPRGRFGVLPYGVPALDRIFIADAKKTIGWIGMTDDVLSPNPWDSVPSYFDALLAALA